MYLKCQIVRTPTYPVIGSKMKKKLPKKEFIKLKKEWYDKLKEDGFKDLEWFDPKTGLGQGSPYLKNDKIPTTGALRKNYSPELPQHYRLCQNFLSYGPFHLNLAQKYEKNHEIFNSYTNFGAFLADQDPKYSLAESILWELYCEGKPLKTISDELRRLYKLRLLDRVPKRWGKAHKGLPFSIYWVKHKVDKIKLDCAEFNFKDPEGLYYDPEEISELQEAMENDKSCV